jgi:hypothetical protein
MAAKAAESSTIGKGKRKVAPARAKVYTEVEGPVSDKSLSISANAFAHSATDASCGRQSHCVSRCHTNGAARSAKQIRVGVLGGGRVEKSLKGRYPSPTRDLEGSWQLKWTSC